MFDPAYRSATQYFPSEQNWGTLTYAPVTTASGGGTTIINNNNVYNGILTVSASGSSISSGSLVFANSNDFTFGMVGGTITLSYANTATASQYFFSNENGITFGTAGSVVTASHNGLTNSAIFRHTSQNSQLQFTSAMSNYLGTTYTTHTHSQYVNTSQSSLFQHTSATSAITSNALNTSQSSLFQHTSGMTDYLGTAYTTHTHSQYINTSQSSLFRHTSADSQLQFTSQMSDYLDTGYTTHTHAQLGQALSGSNGSFSFQTATFGNLNGASFYSSNGSMVLSYTVPTQSNQTVGLYASSQTTGQSSSSTVDARSVSIRGAGNVSVGLSGGEFVISGANVAVQTGISSIALSNTTYTSGQISLRDGNGVSWASTTGQGVSITHDLQYTSNTSAITSNALHSSASRVINIIAATNNTGGGAASLSSNVSFSAANNFTFYTSAGNAIVGSFSQSADTNKAGTGVTTAGGVGLSATLNTNGLSVSIPSWLTTAMASNRGSDFVQANAGFNGTNASGTIASNAISVSVAAQTNQTVGLYASSQTTGQSSSSTFDARSISFRGAGIVSVGMSAGEYIISATGGGGGLTNINLSAGTTSNNLSALTFADGNGVSFGLNGSIVTATVQTNYLTTQSNPAFSAAGGSSTFDTLFFRNNDLVSFTNSGGALEITSVKGSIYAIGNTTQSSSHTINLDNFSVFGDGIVSIGASNGSMLVSATQSNQALSGSNGSFTFQTATFGSSNGMHFYTTNGSLVGSYTVPTITNSSFSVQDSATTLNPVARIAFSTGNNITLTLSTGASSATVGIDHNLAGTSSGFGGNLISGSMTHNSSGLNLSLNHPAWLTTARASNDGIGLNTAQTNVTWTVNSSGLSLNAAGYAGTGTTFNGANISGSLTQNSAGIQMSLSVAAPGAAAENNHHNLLGANTAGNTTASGSTIGLSGINLTLSGTNNSVINISAPATSSLSATGQVSISTNGSTISIGVPNKYTRSGFNPYIDRMYVFTTNQASLIIDPVNLPDVQFDRINFPMNMTNATNSSGSQTLSFWVGIYTRNASTLSLLTSASSSTNVTQSGTAGSYSLHSGMRLFSIGLTTTLTEGRYWLGFLSRTTSGGANASFSVMAVSQINSNFLGHFGSSHNTTYQFSLGGGVYATTTTGIPNSIGFNQIRGSDAAVLRPMILMFQSSTV